MIPKLTLLPAVDTRDIPDTDLTWQEQGACVGLDPALFFTERVEGAGTDNAEAKKVCARCEVRVDCLDYALATREMFGVWGGKSERERRRIRRMGAHPTSLKAANEALADMPHITSLALGKRLGITDQSADRLLARLEAAGVVRPTHQLDQRTVYQLCGGGAS